MSDRGSRLIIKRLAHQTVIPQDAKLGDTVTLTISGVICRLENYVAVDQAQRVEGLLLPAYGEVEIAVTDAKPADEALQDLQDRGATQ